MLPHTFLRASLQMCITYSLLYYSIKIALTSCRRKLISLHIIYNTAKFQYLYPPYPSVQKSQVQLKRKHWVLNYTYGTSVEEKFYQRNFSGRIYEKGPV